ncbi:MAG: signal peptidase II [Myxococcota bacterium]
MSESTPPAEADTSAPLDRASESEPHSTHRPSSAGSPRPRFLFFGVVAAITLLLDIASKAWAEIALTARPAHDPSILLVQDHLTFTLAYNKGGAWGLLQDSSELVRLPFFLAVSVLAVLFIVSLYGKLGPSQHALRWGLPLVLGGALGNLSDRITRSSVIDFIDYRADWVLSMNHVIARIAKGWALTDHWPTFNVADIAICIGVGLMAVDMFTSRRGHPHAPSATPALSSQPPTG